ncbi:DNA cytosine methyltransferase [Neorhizobium tomejilense]|uniref:DNA cytosine methyltransferase n=1 Tax=Neorhizobium tomejilense TaxID=2093828 RepID=UPI003ECCA433
MNSKAEALAAAKKRIIELQAQMTNRILQMAVEVEKLLEVTTEREAREFLRVSCNLPTSELSTYVRYRKTLKGSENLLARRRVSFPVLKALVAAEPDAREEILERMDIGARIDAKEISAIRKRLHEAKLTPMQVIAERQGKLAAAVARKASDIVAARFKADLHSFVSSIVDIREAVEIEADDIRATASELLERFESLFGTDQRSPDQHRPRSPAHELACAHLALTHLAAGTLAVAVGAGEIAPGDIHPWLLSLFALSGSAPRESRTEASALRELPSEHERPTVVELCAGAGGMAIGLERAGFDHVALIEFDRHAAATLRRNRPDWTVIEDDIRKLDFRLYRQLEIDLVAGGLPCQPYSSDGYGLGKEDPRDLLLEGVRVVDQIRPRAFLFENVDGLLHARHADHIANVLRQFRRIGYQVEIHRANALDFGIAQDRSRIFIVGMKADLAAAFRMPPTFPERRSNIGDVLVDLMAVNGWTGAHDWARERREQPIRDRSGDLIGHGATASTIVTRRGKPRRKEAARWGGKGVDIAGLPDQAPTPDQASKPGFVPALTARMRARLQNFEDDWEFCGGKQAVADQIGNAFPPRMAAAVGLALHSAIKGVRWDMEAMLWPRANRRHQIISPPLSPVSDTSSGAVVPYAEIVSLLDHATERSFVN